MSLPIRRSRLSAGLIGALALLGGCSQPPPAQPAGTAPANASASVDADMATCSELGGETAPRVTACTSVIQSNAATTETRSRALNNRGVLFSGQGDSDHAIADFDEAIRINPPYAAAFYNRAQAWRRKGDTTRADADSAQAVRLDPNLAGR